jgi:hypothetical protein
VDDLFDMIRRHPPTDDANDVMLIPSDYVGKSVSVPLANSPDEVHIF